MAEQGNTEGIHEFATILGQRVRYYSKSVIFNAASYLKGKRWEILEGDKSKQPMMLSTLDQQNYNVIKTVKYSTQLRLEFHNNGGRSIVGKVILQLLASEIQHSFD